MLFYDMDKMSDLMNVAAKKLFIRYPKFLTHHVFSELQDAEQVGWVRMLESKKIKEIMKESAIDGNEGLIITIAYRGMIDYIRSVTGREGKRSRREQQVVMTTYYMDYYSSKDGGDRDMPLYSTRDNGKTMVEQLLAKEVNKFMRKTLSCREKMIMDYLFKDDMTQREAGKKFKVTESRINQIKTQAIKTISKAMRD